MNCFRIKRRKGLIDRLSRSGQERSRDATPPRTTTDKGRVVGFCAYILSLCVLCMVTKTELVFAQSREARSPIKIYKFALREPFGWEAKKGFVGLSIGFCGYGQYLNRI